MLVEVQVSVSAPGSAVWAAAADIENAAKIIRGIESIEIVEKPASGFVGLRWRETRMLFGKPATVEKWITAGVDNEFYKTRAESDGFVFLSTTRISDSKGGCILSSAHDSQPQDFKRKLMAIPMSLLFKGVIRKALLQDLNDMKAAAEMK